MDAIPDIVEETRQSPPKTEYKKHKSINSKEILIHIDKVQGLERQGWQPIATTYVSVERLDDKHSLPTTSMKGESTITWSESVHMQVLGDSSKVHFEIRRRLLKNKVLGTTETFEIRRLLEMQRQAGDERDAFIELDVKLAPPTNSTLTDSKNATLTLSIRELQGENFALAVKSFREECRKKSLEGLRNFTGKISDLRKAFNTPHLCLLDLILGTLEGIRKIIADPLTRRIDKTPVDCLEALNKAFTHTQSLTVVRVGKSRQTDVNVMMEMFPGTMKALQCLERVLRTPQARFHAVLEYRVSSWTDYFQDCGAYLAKTKMEAPALLRNINSRRICCPDPMASNDFSGHVIVPMELPITDVNIAYDRPDLVRAIAEWVYTPSDNFDSYLTTNTPNIFCLSGAAGCGKTQMGSRIIYWLRELESLGGYFSFNGNTEQSPGDLLNALPMTLAHQARTIQPDTDLQFTLASAQTTRRDSVVDRFEQLFINPLKAFEETRRNDKLSPRNPIDPMVFVIDDVGSRNARSRYADGTPERLKEQQDEKLMLINLIELLTSEALRRLPPYVKFLVLCRSDTGLDTMLKDKKVGVVSEMGHIVQFVEPSPSSVPVFRTSYGDPDGSSSGVPRSANARSVQFEV